MTRRKREMMQRGLYSLSIRIRDVETEMYNFIKTGKVHKIGKQVWGKPILRGTLAQEHIIKFKSKHKNVQLTIMVF
jgi:hypothetical protein